MTSEQDNNIQSEAFDEGEYELVDDAGEDGSPYSQSDATRGIEDEEEDAGQEDMFSHLGDSSDDPEQKRRYMEYLSLIKEIECQNQMVEDIKAQIMEMCAKPCKTKCETKEIKRLRVCMEQEIIKLRCLMTKAIELQNFGSRRRYQEIPIATTIDEDNMTPYVGCIQPQSSNWKGADASETDKPCSPPCPTSSRDKDDRTLRALCKAMGKMKICCPEDKKLVKEIAAALLCKSKRQSQQPPCGDPCGQRQHQQAAMRRSRSSQQPCSQENFQAPPCADSLEKLKQKIVGMQSSVNRLKQEICRREREKEQMRECDMEKDRDECYDEPDPIIQCLSKRSTKNDEMEKLKANYVRLLAEFSKKDCQLKELEQRMKGFCGSCDGGNKKGEDLQNADQSELVVLRAHVNDLKEEQIEFKCLMKEQSQQLEDYRNKYLVAQQKVEEQAVTLEKLNLNNKRIEKQINTEVKEIRAKFQEKLNELLHFPKLLENEQLKLATACKEKDELHGKLMLVCKELQAMKAQMESPKENTDCRPQLAKCQLELQKTKTTLEEAERQRDLFCEQLKTTQDDLDTLRSESAKIIARTKERSEMTKMQMQEQINRLEKELAQCRATACLSVSDREAVIREMQGQLNTLSYSFDAAQKQIKTLRNHIAYVSNENCFPVKC